MKSVIFTRTEKKKRLLLRVLFVKSLDVYFSIQLNSQGYSGALRQIFSGDKYYGNIFYLFISKVSALIFFAIITCTFTAAFYSLDRSFDGIQSAVRGEVEIYDDMLDQAENPL